MEASKHFQKIGMEDEFNPFIGTGPFEEPELRDINDPMDDIEILDHQGNVIKARKEVKQITEKHVYIPSDLEIAEGIPRRPISPELKNLSANPEYLKTFLGKNILIPNPDHPEARPLISVKVDKIRENEDDNIYLGITYIDKDGFIRTPEILALTAIFYNIDQPKKVEKVKAKAGNDPEIEIKNAA